MLPSIVRRVDHGHASSCWTGGPRVLLRQSHAPVRPHRHSLQKNKLDDEAQQAVKDAAGSGVSIIF